MKEITDPNEASTTLTSCTGCLGCVRTGAQQPLRAAQHLVQALRDGHRRPRQALRRRRHGTHGALRHERRTQAPAR